MPSALAVRGPGFPEDAPKKARLTATYRSMTFDFILTLTYGPRKAVAEVSNHKEPIGRKSGIQLVRKSMDFTFNCFVLN